MEWEVDSFSKKYLKEITEAAKNFFKKYNSLPTQTVKVRQLHGTSKNT